MARNTKEKRDPVSIAISVVIHLVLVGAVGYWAHQSGVLEEIKRRVLQAVRSEKEQPKEQPKPVQRAPSKPLPPINQGVPQQASSGARRAVASDAPPPSGESFITDTRTQTTGASSGAVGAQQASQAKAPPVVAPKPPPRVELRPPVATGRGSTAKLLSERQNSASVSDAIGSEAIDRSTSSDAGDVVSKVTGTSIVDGKFAVVRGLSDRYTATLLNGAEIPTPDPYRRQVQLDIFPAKMISAINVTKTFTPDLPGSFAGGLIDVQTKSFPEKFNFSFSAGTSYNPQANLRDDFLGTDGGGRDALGMDDGTRALPSQLNARNLPELPRNAARLDKLEDEIRRRAEANRVVAAARSFKSSTMAPFATDSSLNQSYNFSLGDTLRMFERPFGYFVGLDYKNNYSAYQDGIQNRRGSEGGLDRQMLETRGIHEVNWSAVANVAYQFTPEHEVSFNFLYNQGAEDIARHAEGKNLSTGSPDQDLILNTINYIERNLTTYQVKGSHTLPEVNHVKLDWVAAMSSTLQDEPDVRYFNYYRFPTEDGGTGNRFDNTVPQPQRPTRFFRTIEEDNKNWKADVTVPFREPWLDLEGRVKFGGGQSFTERTFMENTFSYLSDNDAGFVNGEDPNRFLDPQYLNYQTVLNARGQTNYVFSRYLASQLGNSSYTGEQTVDSYYAMMELPVSSKVRLIGGARVESTAISINAVTPQVPQGTNFGITHTDILPALGLVWAMRTNMNLRLNYGKTLARPAFREISPVRVYDLYDDTIIEGNPALTAVNVANYDARWEWFPRLGEVLSFGVFYKELKNAIEKYSVNQDNGVITFINRPAAKVYGAEIEARKSLDFLDRQLANFTLGANFSWIHSETELSATELFNKRRFNPDTESKRPLYDQSPYIINLDLSYSNPGSGTTASLAANLAGPRIYLTTGAGEDVYEHPPVSLDFVISQRISRHWKFKFGVKNILDATYERTYGDEAGVNIFSQNKRGRTYGVSLSCEY